MAVDVSDLIDLLKSSVSPPGTDLFPDAVESDWLNNLRNGFWDAVLDGIITGYTEDDGSISPVSGTIEFPKDLQQLTILYAGITILRNYLMNMNSMFRSKAGPVEFETQKAPSVLKGILDELVRRRTQILTRLLDTKSTNSYYIDSAIARDQSMLAGNVYWLGY